MSNKWEDFNAQLDENITLEQLFNYSKASHIKRVLITTNKDLEEAIDQRKDQQVSILTKESLKLAMRKSTFKTQEDNELRVNPKHLVHYMLLQIAYMDNYYNIYKTLKKRNYKYLVKIYQIFNKLKYRNIMFIYKWHLTKK